MIVKEIKIDTKYLNGMEYVYKGDEFNELEIFDRDRLGIDILIRENKKVHSRTYVRKIHRPFGEIEHRICTVDYI